MAELVDAYGSGPYGSNPVGVQISLRPQKSVFNIQKILRFSIYHVPLLIQSHGIEKVKS